MTGRRSIVLLCLWLGTALPSLATDPDILAMERRMWEQVNTERTSRKLPTLEFDEQLAHVAREHSSDMIANNFFAHESPTTGSANDRVFKAGIPAGATGENIAINVSVAAAHVSLMESPGHRANILSKDYDRLGIGIVRKAGSLYITQCFRKALSIPDPEDLIRRLYRAINVRRKRANLTPLAVHPTLEGIAREVARRQNTEQQLLSRSPGRLLQARGLSASQFWSWVCLNTSARPAVELKEILRPRLNAMAVGIVVNRSQERGLGMLWMVVLLAEIR